ncbi:diguanylate cyclase domain-containing protein [Neobacillus vireti]|uniref:diguanylate cyclase domain-containing protein n=1 Tax=Neobacillus vireti TaxID=220686 RepID=UPI003000BF4E
MIKDLISNATILIATFTMMGQLFKNKPLHSSSRALTKIYWGICYGILGNILMQYSFQINTTTIADLRHLAIVIAAAFGGYIPAIIASGIIALGRLFFFGYNETALLAAIGALLTGIACSMFSKLDYHPAVKAFYMNLIGLFFISIVFVTSIEDRTTLTYVLITHYLVSFIGGFLAYHLSAYIANSNAAERELHLSLIKLKESKQKLNRANEKLNRLSYMDGLTGIGNRRHFDETLTKEWSMGAPRNTPITLIMFDIDYFKKFNDTYGHLEGDHCLQRIAEAINKLVIDKPNITFCRYGGEEFAMILSSTEQKKGMQLAELVQEEVESLKIAHISSEISKIVTLSIGMATLTPSPVNTPNQLIHLADTALYTSKNNGRNTISIS